MNRQNTVEARVLKVLFFASLFAVLMLTACTTPTRPTPGPIADPVHKLRPHAPRREPPEPAEEKNLFVLIEGPGGKTGTIAVGNKEGAQTITQPNSVSKVKDSTTPPAPSAHMDEKEIKRIFGKALAALPHQAVTFILYFKRGSTDFTKESAKTFPSVLAAVDARKPADITVVGHADGVGTKRKNYILSRNRAERVKQLLVSRGVAPKAVEASWRGADDPPIKTRGKVSEPRNRVVEITVK